jgi:hypothetical protein
VRSTETGEEKSKHPFQVQANENTQSDKVSPKAASDSMCWLASSSLAPKVDYGALSNPGAVPFATLCRPSTLMGTLPVLECHRNDIFRKNGECDLDRMRLAFKLRREEEIVIIGRVGTPYTTEFDLLVTLNSSNQRMIRT